MLFTAAFEVLIIHPCKAAEFRLARPLWEWPRRRYRIPPVVSFPVAFVMQPVSGLIAAGGYIAGY